MQAAPFATAQSRDPEAWLLMLKKAGAAGRIRTVNLSLTKRLLCR
jgi:hypothetical protein